MDLKETNINQMTTETDNNCDEDNPGKVQDILRINNRVAWSNAVWREELKDEGLPGSPHVARRAVEEHAGQGKMSAKVTWWERGSQWLKLRGVK